MRVVGIDLSYTSTGICKWDGSTAAIRSKPADFGSDEERIDWITMQVVSDLQIALEPALVVIEGYAFASIAQREKLGELGGMMKHRLWSLDNLFVVIPPATLKKWQTGKGNAKKDVAYAEWVHRMERRFPTNDEADAHALWTIGKHLIGEPVVTLPAAHLLALKAVRLPTRIVKTLDGPTVQSAL